MGVSYYIDESGNTGTMWMNIDQPYFTYGGWIIFDDEKENAESYFNMLLSKTQAIELKSKNFMKKKTVSKDFKEIFLRMIKEYNALPVFGIANKKYMVAAKIVETFFDCAYNPAVNEYLTYPYELKKALANSLVGNNDILILFSTLISDCAITIETMKQIKFKLVEHFVNENQKLVADSLRNLEESNLIEMIEEFSIVSDEGKKKNRLTLTGPLLIELLKNVELLCMNMNAEVEVYHDKLRGYDEYFMELKKIFLKKCVPSTYGIEGRSFLSNYPHIAGLSMKESRKEVLIQASDLLCGFLSNLFYKVNQREFIDENEKEIIISLVRLREQFVEDGVILWNWYAPYDFEYNMMRVLIPEQKLLKRDYQSIINNDFQKAIR